MEKTILISVSPYVQKYYFNEDFNDVPESIKEELRAKLAVLAESIKAIVSVGFYKDGELFIEERHDETIGFDDIGAGLEIKKLQMKENEMFKSLKLWYMIYKTQNGQIVREIVVLQSQKKTHEEILEIIEKKYGEEGKVFAQAMLSE